MTESKARTAAETAVKSSSARGGTPRECVMGRVTVKEGGERGIRDVISAREGVRTLRWRKERTVE